MGVRRFSRFSGSGRCVAPVAGKPTSRKRREKWGTPSLGMLEVGHPPYLLALSNIAVYIAGSLPLMIGGRKQ